MAELTRQFRHFSDCESGAWRTGMQTVLQNLASAIYMLHNWEKDLMAYTPALASHGGSRKTRSYSCTH